MEPNVNNNENLEFNSVDFNKNIEGQRDEHNAVIKKIYYSGEKYIIYETDQGDLVYSCDPTLEKSVIPNIINGFNRITALLNISDNQSIQTKYKLYLISILYRAFNGIPTEEIKSDFEELMLKVKDNINSISRLQYLRYCLKYFLYTTGIGLIFWLLTSFPCIKSSGSGCQMTFSNDFIMYMKLACIGTMGGLFSVYLRIKDIVIDYNIPKKRTETDAYMRMVIAGLCGIIIYWAVMTKTFFGFLKVDDHIDCYVTMFLALIGGFSERLIPDILAKAEQKSTEVFTPEDKTQIATNTQGINELKQKINPDIPVQSDVNIQTNETGKPKTDITE